MDFTSILWSIAGVVLGVIAAFGTLFLIKAGENLYAWAKKKVNPKATKE